jgi:hypothetical protein
MAKRTQKQRILAAIVAKGGKEVKVTSKSVVMTCPWLNRDNGLELFLYVGNNGSLRAGRTKGESIPYNKLKARFLEEQS